MTRSQVDEALHASGLLDVETDKAGGLHWTVRRPVPGNDLELKDDRQRVWDIPADALLGDAQPPAADGEQDAARTPAAPVPDPLPGELLENDRIILFFAGGENYPVTVHSVTRRGDGQLVINYIRDDGQPDAVITPPDQPVRRATGTI
jgi:hypothetical protein